MLHHQVEQMLQKISPLQKCQEELGSLRAELEEKKVRRTSFLWRSLPVRMSVCAGQVQLGSVSMLAEDVSTGGSPALAAAEVSRDLCVNACGFVFPVIIVI